MKGTGKTCKPKAYAQCVVRGWKVMINGKEQNLTQPLPPHLATFDPAFDDAKSLFKQEMANVKVTEQKENGLPDSLGEAFDKAYVPMQVAAHEKAVSLFAAYAESGDNEALKNWAGDTLPALKEHLKEAKALNTEIAKPAKTVSVRHHDLNFDAACRGEFYGERCANKRRKVSW